MPAPASGFHRLRIAAVSSDIEAAICVRFAVPASLRDSFRFIQGQYLTLRAIIAGQPLARAYSICSGVDDEELCVAIKRVEGGVFSNFANDTFRAGYWVDAMPPQGSFFTKLDPTARKKYLLIAAGSGITPILSHIKTILVREPHSVLTLIYGNRSSATMLFREQLSFIKNRFLARFQWINIMSREDQGSDLLSGRVDNRKGAELNRRLIHLRGYDEFLLCGPESMMSEVSRGLRSSGVAEERIHYELFASSAADASAVLAKHELRARERAGQVSRITIVRDGRATKFDLSAEGGNILDAGIGQGLDLPFSCRGGVCSTCKAKLVAGTVDMDLIHGLTAEEIAAGYVLTCQAHPVSEQVVVDYDQR
jgi:ring-1,2-phenylacetyl-CoA epoxidase subunit PaaE